MSTSPSAVQAGFEVHLRGRRQTVHLGPSLHRSQPDHGPKPGGGGEGQVSVDSADGSPFKGAVYITTNGGAVRVYANSGEKLGELTGFNEACGVSVDPANGDVYVGDYANNVWRFKPDSAVAPVTNASYLPKEGNYAPDGLCNIDAQSPSFVYTWNYSGGGMSQYPKSAFSTVPISPSATPIGSGRHAQSDPQNERLLRQRNHPSDSVQLKRGGTRENSVPGS